MNRCIQFCVTDQDHSEVQRDHKYLVVQRLKVGCQQVLYHAQERLCFLHYTTDIGLYPNVKIDITRTYRDHSQQPRLNRAWVASRF
jgi:hypothetical protein